MPKWRGRGRGVAGGDWENGGEGSRRANEAGSIITAGRGLSLSPGVIIYTALGQGWDREVEVHGSLGLKCLRFLIFATPPSLLAL